MGPEAFREGVKSGTFYESEKFSCEKQQRLRARRRNFNDFGKRLFRKVHFWSKVGSEGVFFTPEVEGWARGGAKVGLRRVLLRCQEAALSSKLFFGTLKVHLSARIKQAMLAQVSVVLCRSSYNSSYGRVPAEVL